MAEALGQLFGDLARQLAILWIGEVELLAIAMLGAVAFFIDAQVSGYFCVSQAGGAAVGVPTTV